MTLGVLLCSIYTVQMFVHGIMLKADPDALVLYLGSFGLLFLLLSSQYLYGWNARRNALPPDIANRGLSDAQHKRLSGQR